MKSKICIVSIGSNESKEYKSLFNSMGYDVVLSSDNLPNGNLAKIKPDLILIDIGPDKKLEGLNLADEIDHNFNIPVLISLDNPEDYIYEFTEHRGIYGYLTKPLKSFDLKSNVELALYRKQNEIDIEKRNQELTQNLEKPNRTNDSDSLKYKKSESKGLSDDMYRQIVETTNEGIALGDKDLKLFYVNPRLCEMFGYNEEEIIGKSPGYFLDESQTNSFFNAKKQLFTDKKVSMICKWHRKDGSTLWTLSKNTPIFDDEGNYSGILSMHSDVTSLEKAREKLQRSEKRFKELIETNVDFIWEMDTEGKFTYCSPQIESMGGFKPEEVIGKKPYDFMVEEEGKLAHETYIQNLDAPKEFRCVQMRVYDHEGGFKYIEVNSKPIFSKNGILLGYRGITRDITSRVKVQEDLKESNRRFELMANGSQGLIFVTNGNGEHLFVNDSYLEFFGVTAEQVSGTKWQPLVHPEDKSHYLKSIAEAIKKQQPLNHQLRALRSDGEWRWIETSAMPRFSADNKYIGHVGISIDIDDRKKAEDKEKLLTKQLQLVLNAADMGWWHYDPTTKILKYDKRFKEIFNLDGDETTNDKIFKLIHPDDLPEILEKLEYALDPENPRIYPTNYRIFREDEIRWIESHGLTTFYAKETKKQARGVVGIVRDITDSIIAERKLRGSLKEKDVLLKEIYHRVKNNMQIIASLLSLQIEHVDEEHSKEILRDSQSRVKTMAMIHEKLYLSSDLSHINFKSYVDNLISNILYTYGVNKERIKLNLDVDNVNLNMETAIPIGLIINELVVNSIKYAFPDRSGKITIKLKEDTGNYVLTVGDNGVGLPGGLDLDSLKSLGLVLVTNLVEQIDGKLTMKNQNGTMFRVSFNEVHYQQRI